MMKKMMFVGIVILLTCSSIPSSATLNGKGARPTTDGNTLYVGGSGPGNYTTIQAAINASTDGDTIFVYSGVYHEKLRIFKAIHLIGESKTTAIIETVISNNGELILIGSNNVTISGFTLYPNSDSESYCTIISVFNSNNITISENNIQCENRSSGISLSGLKDGLITDNSFTPTIGEDIHIEDGTNCIITYNIFNGSGIHSQYGRFFTIANNVFTNSSMGVLLRDTSFTIISNNTFFNVFDAISLEGNMENCVNTTICFNTIDNPTTIHNLYLFSSGRDTVPF